MPLNVFFAAHDKGGLNALLPVHKKLGGHFATPENPDLSELQNADILICGTSLGDTLDKAAINLAKAKNIPCAALLDFWVNYSARFTTLPDQIFVMDELAKSEMLEENFKAETIKVTGNPYFDHFNTLQTQTGNSNLFISQPFTELPENPLNLNEIQTLEELLPHLPPQPLKIKLHPRCQNKDKFNALIQSSKLDIQISTEDMEELLCSANLVLGLNSMGLFEAAVLGKKVLSHQPGLRGKDPLITNRNGTSIATTHKEELPAAFQKLQSHQAQKFPLVPKATDNVIQALHELYLHHSS